MGWSSNRQRVVGKVWSSGRIYENVQGGSERTEKERGQNRKKPVPTEGRREYAVEEWEGRVVREGPVALVVVVDD